MDDTKQFFYEVVKNLTDEEAIHYNYLLQEIYLYHDDIDIFKEKIVELQNKLIAEYLIKQSLK